MGYYTRYTLEFERGTDSVRSAVAEHLKVDGSMPGYGKLVGIAYRQSEQIKWYNHEDDMKKLSTEFPTVLFILKGEGEESGDLWIKYFLGGKMQYAPGEIKYPKFDRKKLA